MAKKKKIRHIVYGILALILIAATTVGLSLLKPAAPSVDRSTVWIDTVKRGSMLREVRGLGTLVPVDIQWIPAVTEGRVEKRLVDPGTAVKPDTVILELSNPTLVQTETDAEMQLKAAEASLENLKVQLQSAELTERANVAQIHGNYEQARMRAETDATLYKEGLGAGITARLSKVAAEQLENQDKIEAQRLAIMAQSNRAQLAVQQAEVNRLRAQYALKSSQVEALHVKAGIDGVLQLVAVDIGQQVAAGANLARVAEPKRLKAELKIAETQAKDILLGQKASIDTHNGLIPGHVIRIDPSVINGTRTVDVALDGALPSGAVPDLSVEGTIEIERLTNVLYVGRPVQGQSDSTVGLFKLVDGGKEAVRVPVKLGRSSVNTIEILGGLKEGDQVILSDMSAQDRVDRIRLD